MPYCFSFSSNRVGDCRFSRAHKSRFCEERHQQTQYLLLCHKEIKYASKYMYSISPVQHLYKFACVSCRKILVTLPCTLKNPKVYPKPLSFVRQSAAAKVYLFLRKAASSQDAVSLYHASLTEETKTHIYTMFSSSESVIRCLCATVAFGMVSYKLNTS